MNRILIIEDDMAIARAMALRLQTRYDVACAKDLASAREILGHQTPSLILLDIHLSGMDGFCLAKVLGGAGGEGGDRGRGEKTHSAKTGKIPIVFMTASSDPNERARAEAMGAAGFLEKPYRPEDLWAVVEQAMETGDRETAGRECETGDGGPSEREMAEMGLAARKG